MVAVLDFSKDEPRNRGVKCECGSPKARWMEACERCVFLDGETKEQAEIINLLRTYGDMTIGEISAETNRSIGGVSDTLKLLLQAGRVRKHWREADCTPTPARGRHGGMQTIMRGGGPRPAFTLTERGSSE